MWLLFIAFVVLCIVFRVQENEVNSCWSFANVGLPLIAFFRSDSARESRRQIGSLFCFELLKKLFFSQFNMVGPCAK